MYVESVQNYASSTIDELYTLINKYINSGDITVFTRVEKYTGDSSTDDSLKFYNGNKLIADFRNLAAGYNLVPTLYGSQSDTWSGSSSSSTAQAKYIYRMIVCKHGVMFKTSSSGGSTSQKGCIFFTETKSGETGVYIRYGTTSGSSNSIWTGYYIAWGDQPTFSSVALEGVAHPSFSALCAIPTQSADGNHSVNTYFMPFSQFKSYDGLIEINDEKYYTDGCIAIKDE